MSKQGPMSHYQHWHLWYDMKYRKTCNACHSCTSLSILCWYMFPMHFSVHLIFMCRHIVTYPDPGLYRSSAGIFNVCDVSIQWQVLVEHLHHTYTTLSYNPQNCQASGATPAAGTTAEIEFSITYRSGYFCGCLCDHSTVYPSWSIIANIVQIYDQMTMHGRPGNVPRFLSWRSKV